MSEVVKKELDLPKGWLLVALDKICMVDNGRGFKKSEWVSEGLPIIRIQNLKNHSAGFNYFDGELQDQHKVVAGDLLFAWSGTPGTSFGAHIWHGKVAALNQHIFNVRFDKTLIDTKYFHYALNQNVTRYVELAQGGVGLAHIKKGTFMASEIPLMPLEQQKRIVAKIEELFSHIDAGIAALNKAKQLLKQYRQSVLKAAVTGELTKHLPSRQAGWRDPLFRNKCGKLVPKKSDKYFAYVLECENGSLYKGFSKNLHMRIDQHLSGQGAKWTKEHKPVSIIHFEEFETEKEAIEREKYFKSGSGREWINEIRDENNRRFEPARQLLERILQERRKKWEDFEREKHSVTGRKPKSDNWLNRYKEPMGHEVTSITEIPDDWLRVSVDTVTDLLTDYHANGSYKVLKEFVELKDDKDFCIYIRSKNFEKNDFEKDLKYVNEIAYEKLWKSKVFGGEIMVGKIGNAGRVYFMPTIDKSITLGMNLFMLKINKFVNSKYIYYILKSPQLSTDISKRVKGVGNPTIDKNSLKNLAVPLPSIKEQDEIVRIIEDKMYSMERLDIELVLQLEKAEKNKQSILASAFSGKILKE
jgi:restriction endonuclease S subunit/predicted GIY-YIG superfamily endonuclease